MGSQISQVAQPIGNQMVNPNPSQANYSPVQQQYGGGKTSPSYLQTSDQSYQQPQGKGNSVMYSPTSNQPSMGQPNPYPNTVGQWDNATIQPQPRSYGKGKGG